MAFIPIDAKADVPGSKKGKLTPSQHAQLNAWSLAKKTGIFDCLGKCTAKSTSITTVNNIGTVVFNSGYLVICGRLVECEAETTLAINTNSTPSGKIIARYNLSASETSEFEIAVKTGKLTEEDLNVNVYGTYEFELYSFVSTATTITLTRNNTDYVPDIGGRLAQFEASLKDEGKPLHGYDDTKGTIEERLSNLGFKEGSIPFSVQNATATLNTLKRQGNYVIGSFGLQYSGQVTVREISGQFPEFFRPKETISVFGNHAYAVTGGVGTGGKATMTINPDGSFAASISTPHAQAYSTSTTFVNFGFEAPPIE